MAKARKNSQIIKAKLNELCQALVLADPSDLPALADVHTRLEDIAHLADKENQPVASSASAAAAKIVEAIIMADVVDVSASLQIVETTVSALQSIILGVRKTEEVTFPEEVLALANSSTPAEAPGAPAAGGAEANPGGAAWTLPPTVDPQIFSDFLARQDGVLEELEGLLLKLERAPRTDLVAALRRLIHTLKGEAAMLGLADIERLCHGIEDALAHTPLEVPVDRLLAAKDWLARTIAWFSGRGPRPESVRIPIAAMMPGAPPSRATGAGAPERPEADPAPRGETVPDGTQLDQTFEGDLSLLAEFVNEAGDHLESADIHLLTLETDPENEEAINSVFRSFHTIKGVAGFLGLNSIATLAHESENLLDRARKGKLMLVGPAIDGIFDAVDALKRIVRSIHDDMDASQLPRSEYSYVTLQTRLHRLADGASLGMPSEPPSSGTPRRLGEILVERGATTPQRIDDALARQGSDPSRRLGEVLVESGEVSARDVAHALRSQRGPQGAVMVKETVKVDADRLDRLVEMIGELVIAESMVCQSPELQGVASPQFTRHLGQLDKITRELQEMGTSLRMVPLRSTFQKMARLVRDVARKSNKQVEFVLSGEDTELDKSVVDKIGDPLVHMIRNAVDHGLESSSTERTEAGKPAIGRVELRAFHKGGNIYIQIQDDGRGLDRDAILNKARERGLLRDGEVLAEREIFNLIFQPGFSTAKEITDVSGRGVGMDVVKRSIDALRGQVEIQSTPGMGTTFSIRLPLTLAIIDGMVVRVGRERYIVPTLSVVQSTRPTPDDLVLVLDRGEMMQLQNENIPLFRLGSLFDVGDGYLSPTEGLVVIVEDEGRRIGLVVDELLGQQQTVIKTLGEGIRKVHGISGGAIMSDGRVGLILDVGGLVRLADGALCEVG